MKDVSRRIFVQRAERGGTGEGKSSRADRQNQRIFIVCRGVECEMAVREMSLIVAMNVGDRAGWDDDEGGMSEWVGHDGLKRTYVVVTS